MSFKSLTFGNKENAKEMKVQSVQFFWARHASFGILGVISDPNGFKFLKRIHDPKGHENKI